MKAKKDQLRRFKEAAREVGVDETGAEFERMFAKVVPPKQANPAPKKPRKTRRARDVA